MQRKSQDKQKAPCEHPSEHVRLRRSPLTALACNLTLPKITFSHIKICLENGHKIGCFLPIAFQQSLPQKFPGNRPIFP